MGYESTPTRVTFVRIDSPSQNAVQLPMAQERSADEMARGAGSESAGFWLRPLSGWQLSPLQRNPSNQQELATLQGAIWGSTQLQTPKGWVQIPKFDPISEVGIDYGSGVTVSGDLFWDKQVTAGDDWSSGSYQLTSDGTAFPGPLTGQSNAPLDRVAVGISSLAQDQSLFLRFQLLGTRATSPDYCLGIGFGGPPGLTTGGIGQFYLALGGDGKAQLFEMGSNGTWQGCDEFPFCSRLQTVSMMHLIHISPSTNSLDPSMAGSIVIECTSTSQGSSVHPRFGQGTDSKTDSRIAAFAIPASNSAYSPCPVRVDVRRDLRVQFQIASPVYPLSGILTDDVFSLPFLPNPAQPLTLAWFSNPFGNVVLSGQLFDGLTGLSLTNAGQIGDFPQFMPPNQSRYIQSRFTFNGDGTSTPTLYGYRVQTDGIVNPTSDIELDLQTETTELMTLSESFDEGFDHARLRISDVQGLFSSLLLRSGHRLRVDVQTSETGSPLTVGLFSGYVDEIQSIVKGAVTGDSYPVARYSEIEIIASGAWSRLAQAVSPIRFNYGLDFNSVDANGRVQPYLVTDVLTSLFALAGFPSSSLNLPVSSARLHQPSSGQGWIIEPQASIGDLVLRIASEFFGATIAFDPSLGTSGQWRLISQSPTSSPIASFTTAGVTGKLGHKLGAYPNATGFIRRGSLSQTVQPPRANMVVGYGLAGGFGLHSTPFLLKQSFVNTSSFSFLGSSSFDASSPDYLGYCKPIFIYLPQCSSGEALSFSLRRYYDAECHGSELIAFQSPLLIVTAPNDLLNNQPRPIHANDMISYSGSNYRLLSVKSQWKKDAHQYAYYEAIKL